VLYQGACHVATNHGVTSLSREAKSFSNHLYWSPAIKKGRHGNWLMNNLYQNDELSIWGLMIMQKKLEKTMDEELTWLVVRYIGTEHYKMYSSSIERIIKSGRWSTLFWRKCKSRTISNKCFVLGLWFYLMIPFYYHYRDTRNQRLHVPESIINIDCIRWARTNKSQVKIKTRARLAPFTFPNNPSAVDMFRGWGY
jgi:hypothetical protein